MPTRPPKIRTLPARITTLGPAIATVSGNRVRRAMSRRDIERRRKYLTVNRLCAHCLSRGTVAAAIECDHIVPVHLGGGEEWQNFQGLCRSCHLEKTAKDAAGEYQVERYPQLPPDDGYALA